jgi:four helix bundle protein
VAAGSAAETESHLLVAADLQYLPAKAGHEVLGNVKSIQRMLTGLMANFPR